MDEDTSCDRNDLCKHVFNGCKDGARIPLFAGPAFTAAFVVVVLFNVNRPSNGERERGLEVGAGDDDDDDGFLLSFVDDDDALIVLYKLSRVLFLEELAMDGRGRQIKARKYPQTTLQRQNDDDRRSRDAMRDERGLIYSYHS